MYVSLNINQNNKVMPKVLTTIEYQELEQKFSDKLELSLVKTRKYNLKPYGKFVIKWKIRGQETPNQIPFDELNIYHDDSMPLSEEQEKQLVKFMKQNKTDILCDGGGYFNYYTRISSGLTRVWHKKLLMYRENEGFKELVDDGHSFGKKE